MDSELHSFAGIFNAIYQLISPFMAMIVMGLGFWGVSEMKRRGYQTTYAAAIVRAMGAGVMAAQSKGLDPFTGKGRELVLKTGAQYLQLHVGDAAEALNIDNLTMHKDKVDAQLGVVLANAEAVAQASAIKAASVMAPTLSEVTSSAA